jgi:short subunit dehydrogenase-like uncharacterized protein
MPGKAGPTAGLLALRAVVLVFGATGFSGRMVVEQLLARGLPVRAAARSEEKLARLAERFPAIETAVADVGAPAGVAAAAERCSLLITTVGPYIRYGEVAAGAALERGIPYVDITGEPAWLARVFGEYSAAAAERGLPWLPAFGYDYVPGNLAGALALEKAGPAAVRLDIAYCLAGSNERSTKSFSQGTLDSLEASGKERSCAYAGGELRETQGPRKKLSFTLDGSALSAVAIGSSEHFTLPRFAPWLEEINVGLGWFQPGEVDGGEPQPGQEQDGPDQAQRDSARARIVAIARDAAGGELVRADATGPNPYDISGLLCAWAAERILAGEIEGVGALGPVEAFGLERLREGCAEIGLTVEL